MSTIHADATVGDLVARWPGLSRAFEEAGVDYCCGGHKTLEDACRERNLDPQAFIATLDQAASAPGDAAFVDVTGMGLTELADHIEQTHHVYLRSAFVRLDELTAKVSSVHGDRDERLHEVRKTVAALIAELASHMMKEERVLFPMIRQLEGTEELPPFHCGSIGNPIRQMGIEHDEAGAALAHLRTLTDDYTPPEWACASYRALLDALAEFERDLHQHIHKENNVLFPKAMQAADTLAAHASG